MKPCLFNIPSNRAYLLMSYFGQVDHFVLQVCDDPSVDPPLSQTSQGSSSSTITNASNNTVTSAAMPAPPQSVQSPHSHHCCPEAPSTTTPGNHSSSVLKYVNIILLPVLREGSIGSGLVRQSCLSVHLPRIVSSETACRNCIIFYMDISGGPIDRKEILLSSEY